MKQKLYQLLVPASIKEKLYEMNVRRYRFEEAKRRNRVEEELPYVELSSGYIQNIKVLENLSELLKMMPRNKFVAEIGSGRGTVTEIILTINAPSKLFLIDNWKAKQGQDELLEIVMNKFIKETRMGVLEISNGDPLIKLAEIPDKSLDWILLRSDNSYQNTFNLLNLSFTKIKSSGIIAGCNYSVGDWLSMQRYGVIEAVNKFCKDYGMEMIYLTNESNRKLSYAIRKMSLHGV